MSYSGNPALNVVRFDCCFVSFVVAEQGGEFECVSVHQKLNSADFVFFKQAPEVIKNMLRVYCV